MNNIHFLLFNILLDKKEFNPNGEKRGRHGYLVVALARHISGLYGLCEAEYQRGHSLIIAKCGARLLTLPAASAFPIIHHIISSVFRGLLHGIH